MLQKWQKTPTSCSFKLKIHQNQFSTGFGSLRRSPRRRSRQGEGTVAPYALSPPRLGRLDLGAYGASVHRPMAHDQAQNWYQNLVPETLLKFRVLHGSAPPYLGPLVSRASTRSSRQTVASFYRHQSSSGATCQAITRR